MTAGALSAAPRKSAMTSPWPSVHKVPSAQTVRLPIPGRRVLAGNWKYQVVVGPCCDDDEDCDRGQRNETSERHDAKTATAHQNPSQRSIIDRG